MEIDHGAIKTRLLEQLERQGLTQNAFAEAIEMSQSTVSGQFARTSFSADLLSRAADLFGVTLDWLMDGREPRWRSLAAGRLVAPAPEELDRLAAILGDAGGMVKEMRARYGGPPVADNLELVGTLEDLTEGETRQAREVDPVPHPDDEDDEKKKRA